ncbi:ABC transporter permease [bacterium]|nr:ABC transporter permease [bacterium]
MSVLATKLRRDLLRNRSQVIAIVITVFLGITLFGASFDAYRSLEASYESVYDDLAFGDLWVSGGDVEGFAVEASAVDGVAAVAVRSQADVPMRPATYHAMLGRVVGMPVGDQPEVNAVLVIEGGYLSGAGDALVEQHLAEHYGISPGDSIEVGEGMVPLRVAGIVASPEYLWPAPSRQVIITTPEDFGVVFVADDLVTAVAGPGAIAQVAVRYDEGADDEAVTAALVEASTRTGAVDVYTAAEQPSNWALQTDVKGFGDLSFMFPILFLTAAGLGTWVMLTRLVVSQRAVIGTLVASGMPRRSLFRHYLSYGLVIGLGGAIPGVIAGAVLAGFAANMYTEAISVPVTVVRIGAMTPLVGIAFGIVAGLLAAAFPARRAVRMNPAESMRGVAPTGPGRPTLPERVFPPLRRLPASSLLVLRGVFRNPRRTFSTMLGVVLSLALILVSWGMIDTVDHLVGRQFEEIQLDDARVVLAAPATPSDLAALSSVAGVDAAEPTVSVRVTVESENGRYATSLEGFEQGTTMHRFLGPDGELDLPADGILLGLDLEGLLDIEVGDEVTVRAPALGVVTTERVAGFVDEPLGTFAYASLDHIGGLMTSSGAVPDAPGSAVVAGALVRYDDGADADVVRSDLQDVEGVLAVSSTSALQDVLNRFLGLFYAFVGVMLVFGGALAFAIVFNSMAVNLAERNVEVATLRAAGVTPRRIARLVTAENLLVTILGVIPGLAIGYLVALEFMSAYDSDQFSFDLFVRPSTLVFSGVFIVVVTLISQIPGLRALRRLDVAAVVRERAV